MQIHGAKKKIWCSTFIIVRIYRDSVTKLLARNVDRYTAQTMITMIRAATVPAVKPLLELVSVHFSIVHTVKYHIVQSTVPMNAIVIFRPVNIAVHNIVSTNRTKPLKIATAGRTGALRAEKNFVSIWIIPIIGVNAAETLTVPITVVAVIS